MNMTNTSVEIDLGYLLSAFQTYGSNWLFWVATYLVVAYVYGLRVVRTLVSDKLDRRAKGEQENTDVPAEIAGVGGLVTSPVWVPLHFLWLLVSYPNTKKVEEDNS